MIPASNPALRSAPGRPVRLLPWLTAVALASALAQATPARAADEPPPDAGIVELRLAQASTAPAMPGMPGAPGTHGTARILLPDDRTTVIELSDPRTVKGAPYCADAVHETVQTLADGNRIVRSDTTRLCRDGEGRTRQEVERNGRRQVFLRDPVSGESWLLDPQRRTARALGGLRAGPATAAVADSREWAAQMRDYAERMRQWAREQAAARAAGTAAPPRPAPPAPPAPPTPVAPLSNAAPNATPGAAPQPGGAGAPADAAAAGTARPVTLVREVVRRRDAQGRETEHTEVRVLRTDAAAHGAGAAVAPEALPPLPPLPPLPGAPERVVLRAQDVAPRGAGVRSPLGNREIEGLQAHGERTTWTIAAGRIGNEKPIVITRDVWTSPELMLTVLSVDNDPRSGETRYRLANLRRGEPDAALMRVPSEYTVLRPPVPPRPPAAPAAPAAPASR